MKALPVAIALLLGPRVVFAVTDDEAHALLQPHFAERKLAARFDVVVQEDGKAPAATITFRPSADEQKGYREKADLLMPLVIAGHYLSDLVPGLGPVEVRTAEGASVRADAAAIRKYAARELDRETFDRAVSYQAPQAAAAAGSVVEEAYRLMDDGEVEAAIALLRKATDADPAHGEAWFCLGHVLARAGRPQEALESGEAMIKATPSDFRAYALIAFGLVGKSTKKESDGRAEQMLARYEEGRSRDTAHSGRDPVSLAALLMAAQVYGWMGQQEKAEAAAQLYLDKGGSHFKCHWARGNFFMDSAHWDQAMSAFEKALALNPEDPGGYMHHAIAVIHENQKEWNAAVRALRRAYTLGDRRAATFIKLAYCYENLGRFFDARHAAQEGLKLHPDDKQLQERYKGIQKKILTRQLKPKGDPTPLMIER